MSEPIDPAIAAEQTAIQVRAKWRRWAFVLVGVQLFLLALWLIASLFWGRGFEKQFDPFRYQTREGSFILLAGTDSVMVWRSAWTYRDVSPYFEAFGPVELEKSRWDVLIFHHRYSEDEGNAFAFYNKVSRAFYSKPSPEDAEHLADVLARVRREGVSAYPDWRAAQSSE